MAKNCIICPRRNGSHEHVFPAGLGGRRTNTRIYCGLHNHKLGPLAKILTDQLRFFNAHLGVRPDHSDEPTRLVSINPVNHHPYIIQSNVIHMERPRVLTTTQTEAGGQEVKAIFSSQAQLQAWLAEQKAAGNKVEIKGQASSGFAVFTEPQQFNLAFGGVEGLRSVGYVALTFFAHHFPDEARQRGLKGFKDYVLGTLGMQSVWWDFEPPSDDLPERPFRFGHRIVVGISATAQEAYARVSFFSTLNFAVRLGSVKAKKDVTIIVDIDPLAERAPSDTHERRFDAALANVKTPISLAAALSEGVMSGTAEERFQSLLDDIFNCLLDRAVSELLPQVNAARVMQQHERHRVVRHLLAGQEQRVFNLIKYVLLGIKAEFLSKPDLARLAPAMDLFIQSDPISPTGLTEAADCALELGMQALVSEICQRLEASAIDALQLRSLLGGGVGAGVVGQALTKLFFGMMNPSR